MFTEELKSMRRLGWRHVLPRSFVTKEDDELTTYDLSVQVLLQVLNFASVMASGLMIWRGLGLLTNTESPIVVVLRYPLCANFPDDINVSLSERLGPSQWINGTRILPRRLASPHESSSTAL